MGLWIINFNLIIMRIVSISGIDGSGKSTQLKKLKEYFESKGKKVITFHAVSFSLINHLLKKKKESKEQKLKEEHNQNPDQTTIFEQPAKAVTSGNFFTIWARKIILLIDVFRFKFLLKKLKKQRIDYLLTDRYFYDQIINILYLSYKEKILNYIQTSKDKKISLKLSFLENMAVKFIPKPDWKFFIDVSPEVALKRDREIEQGQEYLIIKRTLYKKFLKQWRIEIIDGDREVEEVFERIIRRVNNNSQFKI